MTPDGTVKVLVEGQQRAKYQFKESEFFPGGCQYVVTSELDEKEQKVVVRSAINQFEGNFIKLNKKSPSSNVSERY
ncbi:hypothetical protein O9993_19605 [Vibrio lentus]|nr:hypothetical protein [Vibrio lentus]